ncbi:MAG: HD domain-containing protein [Sphaerochaetaceae bacterium]|nr:HD domain-containing protein [Sphaerochaetaceae bacterium]
MKFINTFKEGDRVKGIYLCKKRLPVITKAGKNFEILTLQDKTGLIEAKIWNPSNPNFTEFGSLDYVYVTGDITIFQDSLQFNLQRAQKAPEGSFEPSDFLPSSEFSIEDMFSQLTSFIDSVKNQYLSKILKAFFVDNEEFITTFKNHSAAKTIHHSYIGGLLEHTLGVTKLSDNFASNYPFLNRDLLITSSILHDIGKTKELSPLPENDYTEEGNLLGHIVIGTEMVGKEINKIDNFPKDLELQLKHCILAHHGELEHGSPKKPELAEAIALNFADNMDAKMNAVKELLKGETYKGQWLGYQKLFDTNFRKTTV